jgi:hypothetical protein
MNHILAFLYDYALLMLAVGQFLYIKGTNHAQY